MTPYVAPKKSQEPTRKYENINNPLNHTTNNPTQPIISFCKMKINNE